MSSVPQALGEDARGSGLESETARSAGCLALQGAPRNLNEFANEKLQRKIRVVEDVNGLIEITY